MAASAESSLLRNSPVDDRYDGPPDYRCVGRHAVFPDTRHDEIERFNYLAQMNRHLSTKVMPAVKAAFETRIEPKQPQPFRHRNEVRKALLSDPCFQTWSALRRMTMEQRQQAGRWVALRQNHDLASKVDALTRNDPRLELDADVKVPRYVSAVDHHCMPGSYHHQDFPGDVSAAANYDSGLFVTTGGMLGRYTDGGGRAVVNWVRRNLPGFVPKQIVDLGVTLGHNALPIAEAFPDAMVTGIDVGTPMLRYGLARAKALRVHNIRFIQADVSDLSMIKDGSVDWVQSTMFLHELSYTSMEQIFRETYRILAPGGIVLHVEQPQYSDSMPLFEQAMRDWDAFYNNEPFWSTLHELNLDDIMCRAGFAHERLIHDGVTAVVDRDIFPDAADDTSEDYGRKAAWDVIGARK
jgi:ubiquinone/menaquinone biosynthesis C-methylase UbiE